MSTNTQTKIPQGTYRHLPTRKLYDYLGPAYNFPCFMGDLETPSIVIIRGREGSLNMIHIPIVLFRDEFELVFSNQDGPKP